MTDVDVSDAVASDIAIADMDKEEASNITGLIRQKLSDVQDQVEELSNLLDEARNRNAWKAMGYINWEEYTSTEFKMSRQWSYQLLARADVMRELSGALEDTDVDITVIPNLSTRDIGVIHRDREEIAGEIKERIQEHPEEDVAEIIQEVIDEVKQKKVIEAIPETFVQIQESITEPEIIDGEIVDDVTGYMEIAAGRLVTMLETLRDLPEPEDMVPHMSETQLERVMRARLWLLRFTVEVP